MDFTEWLRDEEIMAARAVMELLDTHEHGPQWKAAICSAYRSFGSGDRSEFFATTSQKPIFDLANAFVSWVEPVTTRICIPVLSRVYCKLTEDTYFLSHERR